MSPPSRGANDVDEGLHSRLVALAPAQRDVDVDVSLNLAADEVARLGVENGDLFGERPLAGQPHRGRDRGVGREEVDEVHGPAVEAESLRARALVRGLPFGAFPLGILPFGAFPFCAPPFGALPRGGLPFVDEGDGQAGHEEGRLAGPFDELFVREGRRREEDLGVGPVAHPRAGLFLGDFADDVKHRGLGERRKGGAGVGPGCAVGEAPRLAPVELHLVGLTAAIDLDVHPFGQGVDHGGPDAVQAAGGTVGPSAELPSGVQLGVDDFDAGKPHARDLVDGDAAAVVPHLHRSVAVEADLDGVRVAFQRLVDGVVDDLPQAVHKAARVGGPDVHSGPLANSLKAFENLKVPRGVAFVRRHSHIVLTHALFHASARTIGRISLSHFHSTAGAVLGQCARFILFQPMRSRSSRTETAEAASFSRCAFA